MAHHRLTRHPERGSTDRAKLDALLDAQQFGVLATVSAEGEPWAIPISYARDGDRLIFHGSVAAGLLRHAADGAPVVFTVVAWDGLVVDQSAADIGVNYRSASIRGRVRRLDGDAKHAALECLVNAFLPGRIKETGPFSPKDLAATQALELSLADGSWLYKERTGAARAEPSGTAWTGIVPRLTRWGAAVTDPGCTQPLPDSVRNLTSSGPAHHRTWRRIEAYHPRHVAIADLPPSSTATTLSYKT